MHNRHADWLFDFIRNGEDEDTVVVLTQFIDSALIVRMLLLIAREQEDVFVTSFKLDMNTVSSFDDFQVAFDNRQAFDFDEQSGDVYESIGSVTTS